MFKFKNKANILLFTFFFFLSSTMCVYGSLYRCTIEALVKLEIAHDVLISKCEDRSTDMKDVRIAYKACRKAFKIYNKAGMACEEKRYSEFKGDYYEDMSKEQRKDLESVYRAFIRSMEVAYRAWEAKADADYKLAKVDRNYYKVKKADADYKLDKAKKHLDKMKELLKAARKDRSTALGLLWKKKDTIMKGDNIFTRAEKRLGANK